MTDETDTPIGDQLAAEHDDTTGVTEHADDKPAEATPQPNIDPDHDAEIGDEPADADGTFNAVDGSERPKYGHHDGRFYVTFTVAADGPLSEQQLADCAGNVRLHAVNNGYRATDNSHDVITQTAENGKVQQVIVSVPVEENLAVTRDDSPQGDGEGEQPVNPTKPAGSES